MTIKVSYVVITRDRRELLLECLASLDRQSPPARNGSPTSSGVPGGLPGESSSSAAAGAEDRAWCQLIVVDNGSTDGTPSVVRARYPQARLIELGENRGVAGGRNVGLQQAGGELCVLIDDDATLPDSRATARIVTRFDERPDLTVAGLLIQNALTGQPERAAIPHRRKDRVSPDRSGREAGCVPADPPAPEVGTRGASVGDQRPQVVREGLRGTDRGPVRACAYFTGAGFVVRRQRVLEVGGFWEPLVYAGEELDLSYRLIAAGDEIAYFTDVCVVHHATPQARPSAQFVYYQARNRPWIALRHLPGLCVLTTAVLWWGMLAVLAIRHGQAGAWLRGIRDCLRGAWGVYRERRSLSRATLRRIWALGGRIWY